MPCAHPTPKTIQVRLVLMTLLVTVSICVSGISADEGREVVKLKGTLRGIGGNLVFFSPDGSKLLTVGQDAARVWDLRTMKPVADAAMKHDGEIEDAGWLADGERVFTAGR